MSDYCISKVYQEFIIEPLPVLYCIKDNIEWMKTVDSKEKGAIPVGYFIPSAFLFRHFLDYLGRSVEMKISNSIWFGFAGLVANSLDYSMI